MNKMIYMFGVIFLLMAASVFAFEKIDYRARCDVVLPATDYRSERVFPGIGIWGRSGGGLVCFVPGHKVVKPVVAPVVVVPEPVCVPTEVCSSHDVVVNADYECVRWNKWHHCIDHDYVCDDDYSLFCDEYVGCGHSRVCVDWDCKKTVSTCTLTGCGEVA